MDKVWINGNFYTCDVAYPACSAMYARDGVIVAMGDDERILALAKERGCDPEITDLAGRFVLPGFIDSHLHIVEYAMQDSMVHLEEARSFQDVKNAVAARLDWARANGKWISAVGFNQDDWDVKKMPTRKDLDEISEDVPITIRRACLHVSVCNTKALSDMGLLEQLPDEGQENFERFEDGTINGVIREASQFMIFESFPPLTKEELKDVIVHGCKKAAEKGIVELHTDDFHSVPGRDAEFIIQAYKELCEEDRLPIRVQSQCYLRNTEGLASFLAKGHNTGETFGNYTIGPLKVVMDGSLGAHTAYMRKPYLNGSGEVGLPYYSREELFEYIQAAHDAGMQIAVHCIGDAALDEVLDAFESAQWKNPRTDCRHGIVHCQIMDKAQQDRFREMGIIGYVQPIFLRCDMNIVDECVGPEIGRQSYNWRRFVDQGVHISGGSDCPVEGFDVLDNIQYAVTRKNFDIDKAWYPENALTLPEAIRLFTVEGAYAAFSEGSRGSLGVGKEASFVVLDRSTFEVPAEKIGTLQVLETVSRGKTVYHKG